MKTRHTARAVLFDPSDRVLLFEFMLPKGFIGASAAHFWATPGGEIEVNEDVRDALIREVREETGIEGFEVGPELWFGSNLLTFKGVPTRTLERFFYVRSPTATLGATNWTEIEKDVMRAHRWWRVPDLHATTATIFPPNFARLVEEFLRTGTIGPKEIPL
jgi:8-oxo-dGTP pyrophosphatase MutT (NUDIX family)